jgi:hypothetical protein
MLSFCKWVSIHAQAIFRDVGGVGLDVRFDDLGEKTLLFIAKHMTGITSLL